MLRLAWHEPLATWFPVEMLDGVGDVAPLPIEARRLQRLVENATGWADERRTGEILVVARLFADQHDARASCAFAEHGLRRVRVQIAAAASGRSQSGRETGRERGCGR